MDFARCTHDTLTPNRPPARGGPTLHVCRTELPRPPARGGPTLHVCRTELPRPPARGGPTLHVCRTELNGQATQATRKRWPYSTRLPLEGYITCSKPAYFCLLSLFYLLAALSPQYQDVSSRLKVPDIISLCFRILVMTWL